VGTVSNPALQTNPTKKELNNTQKVAILLEPLLYYLYKHKTPKSKEQKDSTTFKNGRLLPRCSASRSLGNAAAGIQVPEAEAQYRDFKVITTVPQADLTGLGQAPAAL